MSTVKKEIIRIFIAKVANQAIMMTHLHVVCIGKPVGRFAL
jgi:hypothetical protein